jgi:glycosyltransferase involved in cell wall biosynthesis
VGSGLSEQKLRKKGRILSNPPRIGFLSDQELMETLGYADLYVHASEVELESISCLEAMGSGLVPLISSSTLSATSQFALDCHSLFAPRKPRLLAQKIDYWIEHPDQVEKYKDIYIKEAESYALPLQVERMEQFFNDAINQKMQGLDKWSTNPTRAEYRYQKRIFKKLLKKGKIDSLPESLQK